ncbi:K(+) efflux antiporter 5 [Nymphaea thermarum]|nr:K(+) efflux antiporter 5 [Nymphaea thermarum]
MTDRRVFFFLLALAWAHLTLPGDGKRDDKEIRARFYGSLSYDAKPPDPKDGSIAKMIDRVLEKEFSDKDQPEGSNQKTLFLQPSHRSEASHNEK